MPLEQASRRVELDFKDGGRLLHWQQREPAPTPRRTASFSALPHRRLLQRSAQHMASRHLRRAGKMSHSVTITRTTTTSSGSALFVNTGYLKTLPGLLKLAELLLGIACVGIAGYYFGKYQYLNREPELFFFLVSVALLIGTFCLLLSCLISLSSASIISKTIYEVVYHGLAFILYLAAGLTLLIEVNKKGRKNYSDYEPFMAAAVMGLVLAGLYLFSTFLANRSYRGI